MNILTAITSLAPGATPLPSPTDSPAPGLTPTSINFEGMKSILWFGLAPLAFGIIGLILVFRSKSGNMGQAMTTSMIALLGAVFIGAAATLGGVGLYTSGILFK